MTTISSKKTTEGKKVKYHTITFVFEYEWKKPLYFKYKIEKGDYGTFYSIVSDFCNNDDLLEGHINELKTAYPKDYKLNSDEGDEAIESMSLNEFFDRDMTVTSVSTIKHNTYRINWAT